MHNSRSNWRQRHHSRHYSNLKLTTNARLRGLWGKQPQSLQKKLGTQLLKPMCWICEMISNILQKKKRKQGSWKRNFSALKSLCGYIAYSRLLAVMFKIYCMCPTLNRTVSLKVKPIYPLQIGPPFWVSESLLNAHKAEFWARGSLLCMYNG